MTIRKVREELLTERKSYAENTPIATENMLDCSLGINPYGFPDIVSDVIHNFDVSTLSQYPHSNEAHQAIVDYWKDYSFIEKENIVLTDGSVTALQLLCTVLAGPGAELVCFLPTFTDMVEYARIMGIKVIGVETSKNDNYKENVDNLITAITPETSIVYIDNPNNPTGQSLTIDDFNNILTYCEKKDIHVIIDEAYADFLPRSESAVTLGPKYNNIISVRTLSKGFGLAGARAGYIIGTKQLVNYIEKTSNPYMMNELSRMLMASVLKNDVQPFAHGTDFSIIKGALRDACGDKIIMAETDDRVPICLLRHIDESIDLQKLLLEENIVTCSGQEFAPLGKNCVRLRVPTLAEAGVLISSVRKLTSKF